MYQFEDDTFVLHNDLYQINMVKHTGMMAFMSDGQYLIYILEICHLTVVTLYLMD